MGFLFTRSTSIVDIHEVSNNEEPLEDASAELEATQGPIGTPAYPNETTQFSSERALWVNHPQYFSFLGIQVTKQVELTERDIAAPCNSPSQDKEIGDTEVNSPTCTV